jgi:hypothetical protein
MLRNFFSAKDVLRQQVEAENQRKMNHEIVIKVKRKECEEKITLGWFACLVGGCSPRMVFSPCPPWLWGVFSGGGRREGVK